MGGRVMPGLFALVILIVLLAKWAERNLFNYKRTTSAPSRYAPLVRPWKTDYG